MAHQELEKPRLSLPSPDGYMEPRIWSKWFWSWTLVMTAVSTWSENKLKHLPVRSISKQKRIDKQASTDRYCEQAPNRFSPWRQRPTRARNSLASNWSSWTKPMLWPLPHKWLFDELWSVIQLTRGFVSSPIIPISFPQPCCPVVLDSGSAHWKRPISGCLSTRSSRRRMSGFSLMPWIV